MLLGHLSTGRSFGSGSLQLQLDILMDWILRDGTQTRAGTGLLRRMRYRSKRHHFPLFLSLRFLTLQRGCSAVGPLGSLQQLHQMTSAEYSVNLQERKKTIRFSQNVNKRHIFSLVSSLQHSLGISRGRWQRRRWPATATWYRPRALPGNRDRREPACPPNQAQGGCNTTTGYSTHWNRRFRGRHSISTAKEEEGEHQVTKHRLEKSNFTLTSPCIRFQTWFWSVICPESMNALNDWYTELRDSKWTSCRKIKAHTASPIWITIRKNKLVQNWNDGQD